MTFGRLAAPRRDERARELRLLPGGGLDPTVVDPRLTDLDRSRDCRDRSRSCVAVAGHQSAAIVTAFSEKIGDVHVDLGFERRGEHLLCSLATDFVQHRSAVRDGPFVVHYAQH